MQNREYLIKYLNEQLVSEYEAIFNYLYHPAKIHNKEIREAFEDFSKNEKNWDSRHIFRDSIARNDN
ncbi:hypothetical protein KJ599_04015 [bacterium]|nr:hypothetical protein [bacterium]